MKDLKYLAAFSIPLVCFLGLSFKGYWVWATPIFSFVCIPILELIFPVDTDNLNLDKADSKLNRKYFDWLLYLNLPLVFGAAYLWAIHCFKCNISNLRIYRFCFFSRNSTQC